MSIKKYSHVLIFILLTGIYQDAKSAVYNVDSLCNLLTGNWYLNTQCNGFTGQCTDVYSEELHVLERIPGTDSITWKTYDNGELKSLSKYLVFYNYSQMSHTGKYMIKSCDQCLKLVVNVYDAKLSVSVNAYDGGGQIYGPTVTGLIGSDRQDKKITFQPNPCHDQLSISGISTIDQLVITDLVGKELKTMKFPDGSSPASIDISELPAGAYIVKIFEEGKIYSEHLYKE